MARFKNKVFRQLVSSIAIYQDGGSAAHRHNLLENVTLGLPSFPFLFFFSLTVLPVFL